jgi:hypothetical protein
MYGKSSVLGLAMMILLPITSFAQTFTATSIEEIKNSVPNGSIVIISKEESVDPEYLHTRYVFMDQACGPQLVDRYGPPVDPNNRELKQTEQRMCREVAMETRDGD